ncbi:MAG: efflux RND transporter permease subunit, partial [Planctomycetes bacterium]|nr:efflux RND transporter permease subunit [Planctomycetota bacterium]
MATVDFGSSVKNQLSRANGNRSRALIVYKESSANAVEVCGRIAHRLEEIGADLKRSSAQLTGFEVHSWLDQGEMIRLSIASLARSALWGGAFAVLVLFAFFRRLGMTLLVALAIPFSLLITIIWIFFRGGTFNLMSLTGLTLGIGMLVDNSIVIVENIARKMDVGGDTKSSVIDGVREVGVAVSLATMTTIMVFLPILFIGDPRFKVVATEVIEPVCISVLASLVVALVFVPQGARLAHFLSTYSPKDSSISEVRDYSVVNRASAVVTRWCVGHRVETALLVVFLMVLSSFGYARLPKSTISGEGRRPIEARVELPKNSSLAEANETFAAIEAAVLKKKEELQLRSVTSWFRATGGVLNVFLAPESRVDEKDFFAKLKPILPSIAGVNYRFGFEDFANDQGMARVRVFLQGEELRQLERVGACVRTVLNNHDQFPELDDVKRWRSDERDEIQVHVARQQAQKYGVDTASVSRMVAWALRGARLPDFLDDDREYPFWIRYGASVK